MDLADQKQAADDLLACYGSRDPIDPLVERHPDMTPADAYAVQLLQVQARVGRGERVIGHKVGLTSTPMRVALGVDEPDYGHLFDTMLWPDGGEIPVDTFIQPRVEPEVAFVLEQDLEGPGVTFLQAARAVAFCVPALEVIDSRIRDWRITLCDTIADNGSSGGIVLGQRPLRVSDVDLRLVGCVISRNGTVAQTGAGAAVLGSPLQSLAWLANALGDLGTGLRAGSVVMSGSITAPVDVARGDAVEAELDRLGRVAVRFSPA